MNDIRWRSMDDDETWRLIVKNPNVMVLVETDVTFRIDFADGIEDSVSHGAWLKGANENVKRMAFIG